MTDRPGQSLPFMAVIRTALWPLTLAYPDDASKPSERARRSERKGEAMQDEQETLRGATAKAIRRIGEIHLRNSIQVIKRRVTHD